LDVSPAESLRRIKLRNRDCESSVSLEYLTNLYKAYDIFLKDINRIIPVIKVDYERFRTADEMAEAIAQHYYNMCNIRNVSFDDAKEEKAAPLLFGQGERGSAAAPAVSPTKTPLADADASDSPSKPRKKKKPKQEEGEPKAAEPKRIGFDGI